MSLLHTHIYIYNDILMTVLHIVSPILSLTKAVVFGQEKKTLVEHMRLKLSVGRGKLLSEKETVVFHSWLWDSCLMYLTILSFH